MKGTLILWGGGKRRSWKREALMIGATAGIATAIGAITGGKRGAKYGALSGGLTRFFGRMSRW